ncbi:lytic transglycosylase domain-containing protein [Selenomonas sp. TAMA-11512]|uniref:lytic transglycosylase domain-containing protein n=1 Tax=Selenomonas sp. TAMA-11512 TaxID=3095337 RepID=UPI0030CC341E
MAAFEDWRLYLLVGVLFFLAISLGVLIALQFTPIQKKYLYPYPYQEIIEENAKKNRLDRDLIAGVILNESRFEPKAVSHRGAMGLMQIMPDTATWIAHTREDTSFQIDQLYVPEKNIEYGSWYLAYLKKHFHGNEVLTLAAYNAGLGNVEEWMEEYHWNMDFSDIGAIPFDETRGYVDSVLKNRKKYKTLYPK